MCWYLNETNTDEINVTEVRTGDIITRSTTPDHGFKVHSTGRSRFTDRTEIKGSGSRWQAPNDRKVLRLRSNPDGTVMCAVNR